MYQYQIGKIQNLVEKNDLEEGVRQLSELIVHLKRANSNSYINFSDISNKTILISNRINRLKSQRITNTQPSDELNIENNQIVTSLLGILQILMPLIEKSETNINSFNTVYSDKVSEIEYYIYVSESKIKMLSDQIVDERINNQKIISNLREVIQTLESHDLLGSLIENKPYIYGELDLVSGVFGGNCVFLSTESNPMIFFFGSPRHLLGSREQQLDGTKIPHVGGRILEEVLGGSSRAHHFRRLLKRILHNASGPNVILEENNNLSEESYDFQRTMRAMNVLQESGFLLEQKLKFVARSFKTIHEDNRTIIIGSPLFVSLSDSM